MDVINQIEKGTYGAWVAIKEESDTKKCHINLTMRLPCISINKESFKVCELEWSEITYDYFKDDIICLCGHSIKHIYVIKNNITKEYALLGSECIKRINPKIFEDYKKKKISEEKGHCELCSKDYINIKNHYLSKGHKEKREKEIYEPVRYLLKSFIRRHLCIIASNKKIEEFNKNYKYCIDCKTSVLDKEPIWLIRCKECYKKAVRRKLY